VSSDISTIFPTFCHISELGTLGYSNLHRMLAVSRPLNLWAPSSALLRDPECRITPDEFIRYVRNGNIRVIARRDWLIDRRKRDEHPWEGARWDPDVDGQLRSIMEEDEASRLPRAQRHVVAAEPENGWERAEQYITQNPAAALAWESTLRMQDRDAGLIPPGTLETAMRTARERADGALLAVLRDAFNHGAAIEESDAEVPILLRPEDRAFLDLMAEIQDGQHHPPEGASTRQPPMSMQADIAELTYRMIEALRKIETDRTQINEFVGSPQQDDLLRWVGAVCGRIKIGGVQAANIDVSRELAGQLRQGKFAGMSITELRRALEAAAATATAVDISFAARALVSGADHMGIAGFVAAAFPIGYGVCKRLGWVPGSFSGPRWPFLYAGTESSLRSRNKIADRLDPRSAPA
jgi:hypothetical protein